MFSSQAASTQRCVHFSCRQLDAPLSSLSLLPFAFYAVLLIGCCALAGSMRHPATTTEAWMHGWMDGGSMAWMLHEVSTCSISSNRRISVERLRHQTIAGGQYSTVLCFGHVLGMVVLQLAFNVTVT